MTLRGTIGSLLGALSLGLLAAAQSRESRVAVLLLITALGFGGALIDSLLGATVQRRYECALCGRFTEQSRHCGQKARRLGGALSNSAVNLAVSVLVGICAFLFSA